MDSTGAKLGLALSGGGHRAAFFHIGVLAKLAELGLLRSIEVISTVSGGSIVGALYYLHVKNLLEDKPDAKITDADYIELVREVESDYRQAAATNIRGSGWTNPDANFHMAIPTYSRTDRAGELYERRFYARAWRDRPKRKARIAMRDLKIQPAGYDGPFSPDSGNASRQAKVPVLLLEATTLNTGHNWRFEAGYMGESPRQHCRTGELREDVDKNTILERTAWDALPESCKNFPLGSAVVSSACFPGGFPPMQIPGIFTAPPEAPKADHRDDMVVKLVDGGVHDNQGIEGLRDRGCTHMIVSDGSGQMPDRLKPSTRLPAVLTRIVSIYGDAEREERLLAVLDDPDIPRLKARLEPILAAYEDAELTEQVMSALEKPETTAFMHLQTGLSARERKPLEKTEYREPKLESAEFGVHLDVQQALAKIRTDLDAFCDLEAWALMADGYQLAGRIVPRRKEVAKLGESFGEVGWAFTPVIEKLGPGEPDRHFLNVLQVGKERFLRPARMHWHGFAAVNTLLGLVAAAAVAGLWLWLTPHGTALFIAGLATVLALGLYFMSDLPYVKPVAMVVFDIVVPALLAIPLVAVAWLQIATGKRWRSLGQLKPDAQGMVAGAAVGQP